MRQISHIIFDWDGTLMDSAEKIITCMQAAAIASKLPIPKAEDVKSIIGISLIPAIKMLFEVDSKTAEIVRAHYKQIFVTEDRTPCFMFPDAKEVLECLSATYTLGIATGKARRGLKRALTQSQCEHLFYASITADDAESKPSSDMLVKLLAHWQIKPENAVMIGDTKYDMQMAENIGMHRIGVSFGAHSRSQLLDHNPLHIIDDLTRLPEIFDANI